MVELIELVKALCWPVVILGIAGMFRAEIRQGLARMVTFRYRNFELNFGAALRAAGDLAMATAAATAAPASTSTVRHELEPGPASPDEADRLRRLADVSPRAAILEAWHEVERVGAEAARVMGLAESSLQALADRGILPGPTRALADQLRRLRDQVAAQGADLDAHWPPDQARRYAELARALVAQLRAAGSGAVTPSAEAGRG